jgi:energy-coupling factor transporter transmembrane protein EcfT
MKKIFNEIFNGIGLFLNMALFSVGTVLAFIKCLQTDGLWAVGSFFVSIVALLYFLWFAYYIGAKMDGGKEE